MSGRTHAAVKAAVAALWNAEPLENRVLLSGVWEIGGGSALPGSDDIAVCPAEDPAILQLWIDGIVTQNKRARDVTGIRIWAGTGGDYVYVYLGDHTDIPVTIYGGAGDDFIDGSSGRDVIYGGYGNDEIYGNGGNDEIYGGAGADEISGDSGADDIHGDGGQDTIYGGNGYDDIWGGWDDDELYGEDGFDDLYGDWGDDELDGGTGWDDLYGGADDDLLAGQEGRDDLHGNDGKDTLAGGLGWDALYGGAGSDNLQGGYGQDNLFGQGGSDTLNGGTGKDNLNGGTGHDTFYRRRNDVIRVENGERAYAATEGNPLNSIEDEELRQRLIEKAVQQWRYSFGDPMDWINVYKEYDGDLDGQQFFYIENGVVKSSNPQYHTYTDQSNAVGGSVTIATTASGNASTTNVQEAGVDEADLVKTDGRYIYIARDYQLIVLDAQVADQTNEIARLDFSGNIAGIYLNGTRLSIINGPRKFDSTNSDSFGFSSASQEATTVSIVDLADPSQPTVIERTEIEGEMAPGMTRMVGTRLYLVTQGGISAPEPLEVDIPNPVIHEDEVLPADFEPGRKYIYWRSVNTSVYEGEAEYRARLQNMSLEELLPSYRGYVGEELVASGSMADDELYIPQAEKYLYDLFSVSMIETGDATPGVDDMASVFNWKWNSTMYASTSALYVAQQGWDSAAGSWRGEARTDLYKFEFTDTGVTLGATGEVAGAVLNQFSMSERDGLFRIATTTQLNGRSNNLFVLEDVGTRLEGVGEITGLAFSERIYSCRFVDDRAYIVTFRQTDPLYVIDMSEPTTPVVAGELKIPGFSRYLHPISGNRLIGYGREADENTGLFAGLQLSLFDVSDIHNPTRTSVYTIANTEGQLVNEWRQDRSASAAEFDHHAFSYFEDLNLIAVPVTDNKTLSGGWRSQIEQHYRLELVSILEDGTLAHAGQVEHDSPVLRSLRIGDHLFSLAQDDLKALPAADLSAVATTVNLLRPQEPVWNRVITSPWGEISD